VLRLDVGMAPALDTPPVDAGSGWPFGSVFSVAGRGVGIAVRRTGGAAQGVVTAGTVIIRRVVRL
jgi:hypothetical protein